MKVPIRPGVVKHATAIRSAFRDADPLKRFVVIRDFLRPSLARTVVTACARGSYATFCGYSTTGRHKDLRNEFCEPNEEYVYITIHERLTRPIPELVMLHHLFSLSESLSVLSDLTGYRLRRIHEESALTCWGPGSFLEQHTDFSKAAPAQLVLSLSLTRRWRQCYGGGTTFAWRGADQAVTLVPRLNTAVLFTPFDGSVHWVEQISEQAPPRRRFTWTAFFS